MLLCESLTELDLASFSAIIVDKAHARANTKNGVGRTS